MPVDAKTKYKAKKTKIVFFDIDDTLRVKKTGYIPESIKAVFKGHPIGDYFDAMYRSYEVKYMKPDENFFRYVLSQEKIKPD